MPNIYEFTHYHGRHKKKKKHVAQINVAQNKDYVLRCRVDGKTFERFIERCEIKSLDKSKMLRNMIEYCLDKADSADWKREIKDW